MQTSKTCPSCGGSGYSGMSGVIPGSQQNASPCSHCGGQGWVHTSYEERHGGAGGCFAGYSKVLTPSGWKEICSVEPGDEVISLDSNGLLCNRAVLKKISHKNKRTLEIEVGATRINVTPIHSVQTSTGKWKHIGSLKQGESIKYIDSKMLLADHKIVHIRKCDSEYVFNLIVEDNFNFIVEGCVAHSFSYLKSIRSTAYKIVSNARLIASATFAT